MRLTEGGDKSRQRDEEPEGHRQRDRERVCKIERK